MRSLGILALFAMLAASLYFAFGLGIDLEAPDMPVELYVAMALGVLFSVLIGAGLMALVFYSSRHGYDDRASGTDHLRQAEPPQR
jgi:hypothetical protein